MSSCEVENKLLDLANWAIRSTQFIGYFPLSLRSLNRTKFLEFGPFYSLSIIYTVLLLSLIFAWEVNFFLNFTTYQKFIALFGATEKTVHFFFVLTASFMGLCFRISGLFMGPRTIQFWKDNCLTLDKIQTALGFFKESIFESSPDFGKIKKSLKLSILMNVVFIALHILIVHGYRLHRSLTDDTQWWSSDSDFHLGSAFWFTMVLFHVLNSIWLSFFIKIYTATFRSIARKIRTLNNNGDDNDSGKGIDYMEQRPAGIIYGSEIFQILHPSKVNKSSATGENEKEARNRHNLLELHVGNCISAFVMLEKLVNRFNTFFGSQLIAEMHVCISNIVAHSFFLLLWIGRNIWRQVSYTIF